MEELLGALSRTGAVRLTALSWSPLGLRLPGVREVVPVQRPEMRGRLAQGDPVEALVRPVGLPSHRERGRPRSSFTGSTGSCPGGCGRGTAASSPCTTSAGRLIRSSTRPRLRLMYQALFPYAVRRADRFIAVSRYTADDLVRRAGVPASRIDVVYHGLDPIFSLGSPRDRGTTPTPYVLAVGGVSPRKNTRRLIEAFSRWRARGGHRASYRLLITGTSLDQGFAAEALPPGCPCWATSTRRSCRDSMRGPPRSSTPASTRDSACRSSRPWPAGAGRHEQHRFGARGGRRRRGHRGPVRRREHGSGPRARDATR